MLTKQKIFNKVAKHLLAQKAKCKDRKVCRYRGPKGRKCAIGCLIPDNLYQLDFERKNIFELLNRFNEKMIFGESLSQAVSRNFLYSLQLIHDETHPNQWKSQLKAFAKEHYLEYKKI